MEALARVEACHVSERGGSRRRRDAVRPKLVGGEEVLAPNKRRAQLVSTRLSACKVTSNPVAVTVTAVILTPLGNPGSVTEKTA